MGRTHFVIIPFCLGVEGLQNEFRVSIRPLICHEKIVHGQPAPNSSSERVNKIRGFVHSRICRQFFIGGRMPNPVQRTRSCFRKVREQTTI